MPPTTPPPTQANAERLLKLREAVANAPLEQFDMSYWKCGTHSCAAGWYVRAHPECGLEFRGDGAWSAICPAGSSGSHSVSETLAVHFGLDPVQASLLFVHWDADDENPAAQKSEFLAKLDALLAARGIAAPAGAQAAEGAGK